MVVVSFMFVYINQSVSGPKSRPCSLLSHQIFASNGWNEKNLSMARIFFC